MAKFCTHCGHEMNENAVVCLNCGCMVQETQTKTNTQQTTERKTNTSVILGIVGIVSAWLFALVGHVTSIIGIVLGIREYKASDKIDGLVLSIIGEICSMISSVIGAIIGATLFANIF